MELLPKRTGQAESLFPAIPYLCQDRYDEESFLNYPQRLGLPDLKVDRTLRWTPALDIADQRPLAAMPRAELEPFLQNWLFFGLLNEILGDLYRYKNFVTIFLNGVTEKTIVTTRDLLSRLKEWEAIITQDRVSLISVYKHIAECLNLARACLIIEYLVFNNDLKFHLASVAEILGYAASKACNVAWTNDSAGSLIPIH